MNQKSFANLCLICFSFIIGNHMETLGNITMVLMFFIGLLGGYINGNNES